MITKRKYGTQASVLPSSKRELGRGEKKKKKKTALSPKSENIS